MTFMNSLSTTPSMLSWKLTTTTGPVSTGKCSRRTSSRSVSSKDSGVEMFTIRPSRSLKAVEAAPIIWFMTSHTTLTLNSSS